MCYRCGREGGKLPSRLWENVLVIENILCLCFQLPTACRQSSPSLLCIWETYGCFFVCILKPILPLLFKPLPAPIQKGVSPLCLPCKEWSRCSAASWGISRYRTHLWWKRPFLFWGGRGQEVVEAGLRKLYPLWEQTRIWRRCSLPTGKWLKCEQEKGQVLYCHLRTRAAWVWAHVKSHGKLNLKAADLRWQNFARSLSFTLLRALGFRGSADSSWALWWKADQSVSCYMLPWVQMECRLMAWLLS